MLPTDMYQYIYNLKSDKPERKRISFMLINKMQKHCEKLKHLLENKCISDNLELEYAISDIRHECLLMVEEANQLETMVKPLMEDSES